MFGEQRGRGACRERGQLGGEQDECRRQRQRSGNVHRQIERQGCYCVCEDQLHGPERRGEGTRKCDVLDEDRRRLHLCGDVRFPDVENREGYGCGGEVFPQSVRDGYYGYVVHELPGCRTDARNAGAEPPRPDGYPRGPWRRSCREGPDDDARDGYAL